MTDSLVSLRSLAQSWREDAERFREYGAETLATACERHAEDLEERIRAWRLELLTLKEAADEAGLAYDTLQRKVASGEVPNAGEKNSPRVRRADLHPWLEPPTPHLQEDPVEELAERTLRSREETT